MNSHAGGTADMAVMRQLERRDGQRCVNCRHEGAREKKNLKMKERGEAVVPWLLGGLFR